MVEAHPRDFAAGVLIVAHAVITEDLHEVVHADLGIGSGAELKHSIDIAAQTAVVVDEGDLLEAVGFMDTAWSIAPRRELEARGAPIETVVVGEILGLKDAPVCDGLVELEQGHEGEAVPVGQRRDIKGQPRVVGEAEDRPDKPSAVAVVNPLARKSTKSSAWPVESVFNFEIVLKTSKICTFERVMKGTI